MKQCLWQYVVYGNQTIESQAAIFLAEISITVL